MNKMKYVVCCLVVIAVVLCGVCAKLLWDNKDILKPEKEVDFWDADQKNESKQGNDTDEKTNVEPIQGDARTVIETAMKPVHGDCQWGYKVFSSGEGYMTDAKAVPSASVIKVFVMEYAFDQISQGELALTDKVSGSTVESLLHAMITRSDNDATNTLIEKFGMDQMNQFFSEKGYQHTKVQRKMLDTKAQKEGRDNYTSIRDVMKFLDYLYQNKDSEPCRAMLDIMKKQEVRTKIPKQFPPDVVIANKTGELSNVENDIGIIFGEKDDYAVAFLCSNLADTQTARNAISDAAYNFYRTVEK